MIFIITISVLFEQLKDDTISDENLLICLQYSNFRVVAMAMSRLIERSLCNHAIIDRLLELSQLLTDNKFIGPWQFGHFAIATLALLENKESKEKYSEIYLDLSDNDKFLVNNFIEAGTYRL